MEGAGGHLRPRGEDGYLEPEQMGEFPPIDRQEILGYTEFVAQLYGQERHDEVEAVLDYFAENFDEEVSARIRRHLGMMGH